ncbi:hypothetical protein [Inconstantimicrobium mannanitabidum]|uniref:Uncharacterized protein n=1 Tax=Inconstantimicrobium mannanitabidum TaxID=1604901 RepID=A0ACB5R9F8_9CLOT|nr:hypothetical protein [Clostridium sp. TW13]GKX65820.1 hypothetical protein rsdtw13_10780 [Clostridium sp. TW13]
MNKEANISVNRVNTQRALKLYLTKIDFMGKLDDLFVLTQLNCEEIIDNIKSGSIPPKLANGIVRILNIDINVLVGQRKLSIHEEKKLKEYCDINDDSRVLGKLYEVAKLADKENDVLKAGGFANPNIILNSVKENKIPQEVKKAFMNGFNLEWSRLYNCSKNELVNLIPVKKRSKYNPIGLTEIFFNNGLMEQTSECIYTIRKEDINEEYNEINNKVHLSIELAQYKILRKYTREEYNKFIYISSFYRSSYNYKIITDLGDYRFQELNYVNEKYGYSKRIYSIVDFSSVVKMDGQDFAKYIYEVDFETFYELISDIFAAKSDIESNFQVAEAKKDLEHSKEITRLLIEKYNNILELEKQLVTK